MGLGGRVGLKERRLTLRPLRLGTALRPTGCGGWPALGSAAAGGHAEGCALGRPPQIQGQGTRGGGTRSGGAAPSLRARGPAFRPHWSRRREPRRTCRTPGQQGCGPVGTVRGEGSDGERVVRIRNPISRAVGSRLGWPGSARQGSPTTATARQGKCSLRGPTSRWQERGSSAESHWLQFH